MSNDKHTPLPWWVDGMKIRGPVKHIREIGLDHAEIVASYVEGTNAAFIVRACNSHKALVDALEKSTAWIVQLAESGDAGFWDAAQMKEVKAARAALKLAKGA